MSGPVRRGRPYIVGENRPELFVPDQDGELGGRDRRGDFAPTWVEVFRGLGAMAAAVLVAWLVVLGVVGLALFAIERSVS